MKNIKLLCFGVGFVVIALSSGSIQAQSFVKHSGLNVNVDAYVLKSEPKTFLTTNCSDKINCVGNTPANFVEMGGSGNAITGIYQTFPSYEGQVIGVEFDAAKSPTAASNPVITVKIYDVNVSPLTTSPLTAGVTITLSSTSLVSYSVSFAIPANIVASSNGFAVGITNAGASSKPRIYFSPIMPSAMYNFSWVTDVSGGNYANNASAYYSTNGAIDALMRPIVTTSVSPVWNVSKVSPGCTFPTNYSFANNSPAYSNYASYTLICPSGITNTLSFGDGSPDQSPFWGASHTYSTSGNYIASYTEVYNGWTTNCIQTLTSSILIENPIANFTFSVNNLNVNYTNTSSNLNNYLWDFGDGNTSTQQNPGTHTYSVAGTYTVVLTSTANCGQPYYSTIINVGDVGVKENFASDMVISIYPNPANDLLLIAHDKAIESIEIYNSIGSIIKTYRGRETVSDKTEINVSMLPPGIYFIKCEYLNNKCIRSFVKS